MSLYRVHHDYKAVYRSAPIAFDADSTVDVDDDQAAWVNHDSPGCLVPLDATEEPAATEEPSTGEPAEGVEVKVGESATLASGDGGVGEPLPAVVNLDDLDREQLLAYAAEHGLTVNRRLGEDNLRKAISEAPLPPAVSADD